MENPIQKIDAEAATLRAQANELQEKVASINARIKALADAREVLVDLGFGGVANTKTDIDKIERASRPTKEALLEALSVGHDLWQTAGQLQDVTSAWAGRTIPMGTISPYLTDLKNDGLIVRSGMKVALKSRVQAEEPSFFNENGEAEASPDADEAATSSIDNPASTGAL